MADVIQNLEQQLLDVPVSNDELGNNIAEILVVDEAVRNWFEKDVSGS